MSLIVAFDRKNGELVDCAQLTQANLPLLVLSHDELKIAALQPPANYNPSLFTNVMVQLFAIMLNLFASRRLMAETLDILFNRPRPPHIWPMVSTWIDMIDKIHAAGGSRLGQYREAALYALKGIYKELGLVIDYAASDMLDKMFARNGCVVIVTCGLSTEAESLLISLIINNAYLGREGADPRTLEPLIFMVDDALPLLRSAPAMEAEGGANPLANWSLMGRSRKLGMVCAAQNFSVVSPVFRNNADTVLCFGSYGRDAEELARYLNLTREQAAVLPVIRPGEVVAIARSVWPRAVHGYVPEVQ